MVIYGSKYMNVFYQLQCNNPLTKEPKLDRAMRIAEEWILYDKEIKSVLEENKNLNTNADHKSNGTP